MALSFFDKVILILGRYKGFLWKHIKQNKLPPSPPPNKRNHAVWAYMGISILQSLFTE